VFTARYALSPYIKQIGFVFKWLISIGKLTSRLTILRLVSFGASGPCKSRYIINLHIWNFAKSEMLSRIPRSTGQNGWTSNTFLGATKGSASAQRLVVDMAEKLKWRIGISVDTAVDKATAADYRASSTLQTFRNTWNKRGDVRIT
jgi:hypothetical protein